MSERPAHTCFCSDPRIARAAARMPSPPPRAGGAGMRRLRPAQRTPPRAAPGAQQALPPNTPCHRLEGPPIPVCRHTHTQAPATRPGPGLQTQPHQARASIAPRGEQPPRGPPPPALAPAATPPGAAAAPLTRGRKGPPATSWRASPAAPWGNQNVAPRPHHSRVQMWTKIVGRPAPATGADRVAKDPKPPNPQRALAHAGPRRWPRRRRAPARTT
jgi:hypothetical protein